MSFRRKITRRQFIKGAAIAGGAMMMPGLPPFLRKGHAFGWSTPLCAGNKCPLEYRIRP